MSHVPPISHPPSDKFWHPAWIAVLLLVPVAFLNYLDRQMLATMKSSMMADIPSIQNKQDWGLVLAYFKWTYAILSPIGGWIADRFNRKNVICISLLAWSAVTWWTGHVESLAELKMARAAMGISEAFYIPTALALITDWHVNKGRSIAVGIHQTGIYCGQIAGGFAGFIADSPTAGWRWLFSVCGILGIVYVLPLLMALKNPPAVEQKKTAQPFQASIGELVGNRNFLLLLLYFTLPAIAGWVVRDWMPDILKERFQLGQGKAGVTAVLYVQVASIVGVLIGGFAADRWTRGNHRGRIFTSAIGISLFIPALFSVGSTGSFALAVAGLIVFGLGWGMFDCNNMPILAQIVRPELRATGYGLMNMVSISCGGLGDWGYGRLRDLGVSVSTIFGAFASIAVLSIFLVLLIRPKPESGTVTG
jgi:MFS transporter, Spinster family, sphingosine-1-phosphate transporter